RGPAADEDRRQVEALHPREPRLRRAGDARHPAQRDADLHRRTAGCQRPEVSRYGPWPGELTRAGAVGRSAQAVWASASWPAQSWAWAPGFEGVDIDQRWPNGSTIWP